MTAQIVRNDKKLEVLNRAMLLFAIGTMGKPVNKTQLQKLVFCAEEQLREKKLATPGYRFIRWDHGPWSKDIYDDRDALIAQGSVVERRFQWERGIEVTSELSAHGREILEAVVAELAHLPGWEEIRAAMDVAADTVRPMSAAAARQWSHDRQMVPDDPRYAAPVTIHEMDELTTILDPKTWGDTRHFDVDTLENLAYTLSITPEALREIDEVMPEPVTIDELFA